MSEIVPFYRDAFISLLNGDAIETLRKLAANSVHCVVTSPPYFGLRDYGPEGQIGLEKTLDDYLAKIVELFREIRRVLRPDGIVWLNIGDSYSNDDKWGGSTGGKHVSSLHGDTGIGRQKVKTGFKPKDLMLVPHRLAIALQTDGWWVRDAYPWVKRAAMPGSQTDRATNALEYVFMLTRKAHYFSDMDAVRVEQTAGSIARLSQNVEDQAGSHRMPNRGGRPLKAVGKRDRSAANRNGEGGHLDATPAGSRTFRNTDLWFQSVGTPFGIVSTQDEIVGFDCNPAGFTAEFCTACGEYYDGRNKKGIRIEKIEQPDGKPPIIERYCLCGRKDAWLSHFATFSMKFVEPLIKIATSEHGVCADCGAQYERITEKDITDHTGQSATAYGKGMSAGRLALLRQAARERGSEYSGERLTTGWQRTCDCTTDERVPATVLDPFSGAATTAIVAKKLGRRAIGIDLSTDYCRMAVKRIEAQSAMPLFDVAPEIEQPEQTGLFSVDTSGDSE